MVKAIFFDIDGTLLSFKTHQVPASTQQAFQLLKEKDIKVFVSTGRSFNQLGHIRYLDFDGYITFNGGYCLTKEELVIYKNNILQKDIRSLLDYAKQHNDLTFSFMSEKEISLNRDNPEVTKMYQQVNVPTPPIRDYEKDFDLASVMQINVFIPPEEEAEFMENVMPNSVASRWTPIFADINPTGQSKKVGIDIFLNHFGIELSETMSFGDGGNDITMLAHTQIGIAMGNANPEVKEIADYITDDVDNDGIWNALKHFNII
ncbi:Cof-type HAD-IIB family hydrolase [Sphingobacterium sp. N143]|uniref:Cof-type HAD-IIB family hydrolase n=1 Tax=Sphingobacterium sp. N143 TaxID=2746727 RepID=UPI0025784871|nr:Cof-type HAD-IIB family hydrolase [Sphingobacterium sp. N143]MDM1296621.1 Cof-type HAD-IIB family hydrolase [Sphingobacterium sp. N143]